MRASEAVRVVFLDRAAMQEEITLRPFAFSHKLLEFNATKPDQVAERIANADIVVTNKAPIGPAELASAPKLRLIAIAATGSDVVDLNACAYRGISVCNIRGYAVNTVPEHTFALILALRRSLIAYRDSVRAGRWAKCNWSNYRISSLRRTLLGPAAKPFSPSLTSLLIISMDSGTGRRGTQYLRRADA